MDGAALRIDPPSGISRHQVAILIKRSSFSFLTDNAINSPLISDRHHFDADRDCVV